MFPYIHLFLLVWILFIYFYSFLPYFLSFFPVLSLLLLNFLSLLSSVQLLQPSEVQVQEKRKGPCGGQLAVREPLSISQSGLPASAQAGWRGRSALAIHQGRVCVPASCHCWGSQGPRTQWSPSSHPNGGTDCWVLGSELRHTAPNPGQWGGVFPRSPRSPAGPRLGGPEGPGGTPWPLLSLHSPLQGPLPTWPTLSQAEPLTVSLGASLLASPYWSLGNGLVPMAICQPHPYYRIRHLFRFSNEDSWVW